MVILDSIFLQFLIFLKKLIKISKIWLAYVTQKKKKKQHSISERILKVGDKIKLSHLISKLLQRRHTTRRHHLSKILKGLLLVKILCAQRETRLAVMGLLILKFQIRKCVLWHPWKGVFKPFGIYIYIFTCSYYLKDVQDVPEVKPSSQSIPLSHKFIWVSGSYKMCI